MKTEGLSLTAKEGLTESIIDTSPYSTGMGWATPSLKYTEICLKQVYLMGWLSKCGKSMVHILRLELGCYLSSWRVPWLYDDTLSQYMSPCVKGEVGDFQVVSLGRPSFSSGDKDMN